MADKELGIHLKTTSDTSGLDTCTASLKDLKAEAASVRVEMPAPADAPADAASGEQALDTAKAKVEALATATREAGAEAVSQEGKIQEARRETARVSQVSAAQIDAAWEKAAARAKTIQPVDTVFSSAAEMAARQGAGLEDRLQRVARGAAATGEEMGRATKTTNNLGQAAMNAAYLFDDLQYGFKGVVNNIPQVLLGLGAGAGLTGVISLLAVGLNLAIEKLDIFGTRAGANTVKLRELALEAGQAANAAADEAQRLKAGEEAWASYTGNIQKAIDRNKELVEGLDKAAAAQARIDRAQLAVVDADAALELTQIDRDRREGKLTDEDAEMRGAEVKAGAQRKRYEVEQAAARRQMADLAAKAQSEFEAGGVLNEAANKLETDGKGLLSNADRKALMEALEKAKADAAAARSKDEETPEEITPYMETGEGVYVPMPAVPNPEKKKTRGKVEIARKAEADLRWKELADKKAFERTNMEDEAALKKEVAAKRAAADAMLAAGEKYDDERVPLPAEIESRDKVFASRTKAETNVSTSRVDDIRERKAKEEEAAAERTRREEEKERREREKAMSKRKPGIIESDDPDLEDIRERAGNFSRSKAAADSRLGGGDPRLANLDKATAALADGADRAEMAAMAKALDALLGTILTGKAADAAVIRQLRGKVESTNKKLQNGRD